MTSIWGMQTWRSMKWTSKRFGDTCSLFWRLQVTRLQKKAWRWAAEPEDVLCQRRSRTNHFNSKVIDHNKIMPNILLMEEIPNNHLECIKPCKYWVNYLLWTGDGRISSIATFHLGNLDSEVDMKSSFYSKISPAVKPMGNETPKVVSCDILLQVPWFMVAKLAEQVSFGFSLAFICEYLAIFWSVRTLFCFCVQISANMARTYNSNLISGWVTWIDGSIVPVFPSSKVLFRMWNSTVETRLQMRPKTKSFGISNFGKV